MDAQVKLTIQAQRDVLVKTLALVAPFVEKRTDIPILSCVLICATAADQITLTGTNLDKTITVPVAAETSTPFSVCVSAHSLYQLAKGLPKGAAVTLTQEAEHLVITSGVSRFQLPFLPAEGFPSEPLKNLKSTFTLPPPLLRDMIAKTKMAISTEDTRFYLNGICLNTQQTPGTLYAVATDGHRMAEFSTPTPAGAETFTADDHAAGIIIPRETVPALEKVLSKTGDVVVQLYAERITFATPEWQIVLKAIDDTFPDWKRVMPDAQSGDVLRFDSAAARELIAGVTAAHSRGKNCPVNLQLGDGTLQMSTFDPDNGAASGAITASWSGEELEIGFNGRYLTDILALIPSEAVLQITDARSSVRITDPADPRVVFVLMPMRV